MPADQRELEPFPSEAAKTLWFALAPRSPMQLPTRLIDCSVRFSKSISAKACWEFSCVSWEISETHKHQAIEEKPQHKFKNQTKYLVSSIHAMPALPHHRCHSIRVGSLSPFRSPSKRPPRPGRFCLGRENLWGECGARALVPSPNIIASRRSMSETDSFRVTMYSFANWRREIVRDGCGGEETWGTNHVVSCKPFLVLLWNLRATVVCTTTYMTRAFAWSWKERLDKYMVLLPSKAISRFRFKYSNRCLVFAVQSLTPKVFSSDWQHKTNWCTVLPVTCNLGPIPKESTNNSFQKF